MSETVKIDSKLLYSKLAKIALPISVQGVVSATLGMIDNLMVGFLGETELAAVGIATQIYFVHYLIVFGFIGGTATFMAQFYGAGEMKNIRKVTGFAIAALIATGILFFTVAFFFTEEFLTFYVDDPVVKALAAKYVRVGSVTFFFIAISLPIEMAFKATQQTRVPMIISTVVFTTNTFLNYVFIFGKFGAPALGVAGAALATSIARFLEVLVSVFFATRKNNCFHGHITDYFSWNKDMIKRVVKNAMPTTGNELLWSLGQTMYVAAFSRIGTTAYAAYQAAASINSIFSFAAFSVGDASLILVGQKLGEGDKAYTYALAKRLVRIGTIFGAITGLLLVLSAPGLTGLFNLSDIGKEYTVKILTVYGLAMGLSLYNGINVTGILRGGGDTKFAMIAESSCVWFVAVPLAFMAALVWGFPIYLAVLLIKLEDVVKCILLTKRFISKKWLNNVITGL